MRILLLFIMLAATVAHADTYQWTDQGGTVHFSESLRAVPADHRKNARPLGIDPTLTATEPNKVPAVEPVPGAREKGAITPQIDELKEKMLHDKAIMTLIGAMQGDPEIQTLLNDPAIMGAVQSGDIGALINNPVFMKLLADPRVREIEKSLQGGTR